MAIILGANMLYINFCLFKETPMAPKGFLLVVSHQHSSPQIKVYSEFGGKPHTWDQSQKGYVKLGSNNEEIDDDDNWKGEILFMGSSVKFDTFTRLSWAEYVFVSLSLRHW